MSGSIATGAIQVGEFLEYSSFYNGSSKGLPFYTDTNSAGVTQLNFGYGYNLTANGTTAGSSGIATLQAAGIPQAAINLITNPGTAGITPSIVSQLNTLALGQYWQTAAANITQNIISENMAELSTNSTPLSLNGRANGALVTASLTPGAQEALADMAYNGGFSSAAFGRKLTADLQAGNYGAAAYELAGDSAVSGASGAAGYENRLLFDAGLMLGFTPSVDANNNVTFSPSSTTFQNLQGFMQALISSNGTGSAGNLLNSGNGALFVDQVISQEINQITDGLTDPSGYLPVPDSISIPLTSTTSPTQVGQASNGDTTVTEQTGSVVSTGTLSMDALGDYLANYNQTIGGQTVSTDYWILGASTGQVMNQASAVNPTTGGTTSSTVQVLGSNGTTQDTVQVNWVL